MSLDWSVCGLNSGHIIDASILDLLRWLCEMNVQCWLPASCLNFIMQSDHKVQTRAYYSVHSAHTWFLVRCYTTLTQWTMALLLSAISSSLQLEKPHFNQWLMSAWE